MQPFPEVRPLIPTDLRLVRRLASRGLSFDSVTSLTRGTHTLEGAMLSTVPLTDLGTPTFVLRNGDQPYVAQFRHKNGDQHAHITFIAPDAAPESELSWLQLLDAMTAAAGRRGAITLNAEVVETEPAFAILREAGFGVYARQELWHRPPAPVIPIDTDLLRPETDEDTWAINGLYANVMPRLVMQADAPPEAARGGLVYERDGQILAYISVQEGKCGIYVQCVMHPDTYDQAGAILASALNRASRAERLPIYIPLRRYQDWLQGTLAAAGFYPWVSQAVMVKHTVCRIEQPAFKPAYALEGFMAVPTPITDYRLNYLDLLAEYSSPAKEWLNGISHHRRSGKAQSSPASLPGGLA